MDTGRLSTHQNAGMTVKTTPVGDVTTQQLHRSRRYFSQEHFIALFLYYFIALFLSENRCARSFPLSADIIDLADNTDHIAENINPEVKPDINNSTTSADLCASADNTFADNNTSAALPVPDTTTTPADTTDPVIIIHQPSTTPKPGLIQKLKDVAQEVTHEFDSHDLVLRLNAAPVKNMEADVGRRTTMRLLNNFELFVLNKSRGKLRGTPAFQGTEVLLGWDTCNDRRPFYTCLVNRDSEDIRKDEQDSLQPYFAWKKRNKNKELYYLDPNWIWELGEMLQELSAFPIEISTPSSGFIGFIFLLHRCHEVHLYEMIPTLRGKEPRKCHYYKFLQREKPVPDTNCTFLIGHPRDAEISTFMKLNTASDYETFVVGHAVVPGVIRLECPQSEQS
ncbi:unnamed protein product [Notodromas monacha]|uniref:beta-galactoside alpha-(2,6)-sialyltransferase n=1 Tax=Notodromas monacha TaxID=399045 RepID=A0A7R9BPV1_9CRUS|nr:unnamed protein product [Notodromas monacha]CAG0919233.1 unnamed protein product [Notodromas monacha]